MSRQKENKPVDETAPKPLGFLISWGIPLAILFSANIPGLDVTLAISLLLTGLTWIGIVMLVNAKKTGRRRYFFSGPVFLLGALATALIGFQVIDFGPDALMFVVGLTFILSFGATFPEKIWGKYVK